MKRHLVSIAIAALLALSGCAGQATAPPPATAVAVASATAAPDTATPAAPAATATRPVPSATQGSGAAGSASPETPPPPAATPVPPATSAPVVQGPEPSPPPPPMPAPGETWWEVRTLLVGPERLYALQALAAREPLPPGGWRLLVSDDGGAIWQAFPGALPAPDCLHNLALDYAGETLYASTCRGLYRRSGTEWELISTQETFDVEIAYGYPEVMWATQSSAIGAPVIRSGDGGATWTPAADGLDHFTGVAEIGADPRDAGTLYAIINPRYAGSYLRRGSAEGRWQTMPTPGDNTVIDPGMTIDGATGDLYVITALAPYQLWRSRNPREMDLARVVWEPVYTFEPNLWVHLLASGPGGPVGPALYANLTALRPLDDAGSIDVGRAALHRSLDGGRSWAPVTIPAGPAAADAGALATPPILVKGQDAPETWQVIGGARRYIVDWATFLAMGYRQADIIVDWAAGTYPDGPPLTRLMQGSGERIYLLENGWRRHIPDMETLRALGFHEADVSRVPDALLTTWPLGRPLPSALNTPPEAVPLPATDLVVSGYHPPGAGPRLVELFTVYADGHWPRRLSYSSGNAENIEGAWSPDGERIAFTGCTDGSSGSCAVTVTGWQAWQPLRLAGAMTFGPAWSPDGSRLALWSSHTNTVYLMDADGRNVRELAAGRDPAWMPDGRIAFWAGGPDAYRLVTLDPDDPAAGAQPAAGEIVVYDQQFFPWRPARWLASAGPLNPTGK